MKIFNLKWALLGAIITISFISCNDSLTEVGMSVKADTDKQGIEVTTLQVKARSQKVDSIYLKRNEFLLGKYSHAKYGSLEASYFTEFYYPEFYSFKQGSKIDSVSMRVAFSSWEGDSLTPMTISAYRVLKDLPDKFYSNITPSDYVSGDPIGQTNYQIASLSVSRRETGIVKYVKIPLPNSIGQEILDNNDKINDTESLRNFFKGVYIENDGLGNLLTVYISSLEIYYNYMDKGGSSVGKDTLINDILQLSSSPEVKRINRISDVTPSSLFNDTSKSYVKSPTGICTEITFPQSEKSSESKALNLAEFSLKSQPLVDEGLFPSNRLLLIDKDSVTSFFFNNKLPDNVTSFIGDFNRKTNTYNFGNISTMFNHYSIVDPTKELKFVVLPVSATSGNAQSGGSVITSVSHEVFTRMTPILIDDDNLKIKMVYSYF